MAAFAAVTSSFAADTGVTIYGTLDISYGHLSGQNPGFNNVTNNYQTSQAATAYATTYARQGTGTNNMGFKGTEDLGGGNYSGFDLQTGGLDLSTGSPALAFSREANLKLGGTWGELKVGRSVSTLCAIGCSYDYNYIGAGDALAVLGLSVANNNGSSRRSGEMEYMTPSYGGFTGRFSFQPKAMLNVDSTFATNAGVAYTATSSAAGTATTSANYKDVYAFGGEYKSGQLRLAAATETARTDYAGVRAAKFLAAEWDFGFLKASITSFTNSNVANYTNQAGTVVSNVGATVFSTAGEATTYGKGNSFSLIAPVGNANYGFQYANNSETQVSALELFARYSLSKTTELYAYNTRINGSTAVSASAAITGTAVGANTGGLMTTALPANPTLVAVGIRKTF